jgi:glycosyltransferase involved in cell wall biosynthesis
MGLLANSKMPSVLDLDDDECTRTEMLIPLREAAGDFARANRERTELGRQRRFQRMILSRFQTCFLASSEDRDSLSAQYPDVKFAWLPNAIRLPAETPGLHGGPRGNLLFLGKLDYLPNEDAVLYFCNRILPLLITSGRPVSLRVAGMDAPDSIRKLSALPGVTVVGAVKDVVPEYERAGIAVAPLRAGSGTRIKILEAFSYGVPVVSTSMGAAGLDVTHEVHLLIADTPEEFAAACLRLIEDDRLAERLSRNALKWVRETHSLDRVRAILHGIFSAQ